MSPRTVTPAEAREMLDGAAPGPWLSARVRTAEPDGEMGGIFVMRSAGDDFESVAEATADSDARLLAAAPDLAATVASEPARIEAAVEAERAAIVAALAEMAAQRTAKAEGALRGGEGEVSDWAAAEASGLDDAAEFVAARGTP